MSEMVRKQFYIYRRQHILLKQLSQARGVSEAEIVRRAIEREATGTSPLSTPADRAAWSEILEFVEARKALAADGEPYEWEREDAYDEREGRLQNKHTE